MKQSKSTDKSEKTILDRKKWYNRKIGAIMTTLALATVPLMLTGCDDSHSASNNSSYTEQVDSPENVPEDIAQLDDSSKAGSLVQGRQGCIDKLVQNGLAKDEAAKVCDEITAEAQAHLKQQAATQPSNQQGQPTSTTVVVHDNSMNNALFWYWLGSNNRPYIYYGSPSSGLTMYHSTQYNTYNNSSSGSGSGAAAAAHLPPEHLTSNQSTFLATEHSMRPAVTQQLAARPGVKVVSVPHFTHDGVHTTTHFTAGGGSHSSISHGGFGGHGVATGG